MKGKAIFRYKRAAIPVVCVLTKSTLNKKPRAWVRPRQSNFRIKNEIIVRYGGAPIQIVQKQRPMLYSS
jgi:hypothetical protein